MRSSEMQLANSIPENLHVLVLESDINMAWACDEAFFLGEGSTHHTFALVP